MNIYYSIIIPHKDIPHLLQRCLDSIPRREDVQVIVVDDNSDASVVDFAHFPGLERTDVECYFTKEGKGAGYARNVGLRYARGKWLLFADADDFFHEGMLSMLDNWKDSENDIIFFDSDSVICETMKPTKKRLAYINKRDETLRYTMDVPWGKMIRFKMVQSHHIFFDETIAANDVMFSLKSGHWASRVQVSDEVLYCATIRNNSLRYGNSLEKELCRLLACTKWNRFVISHHIDFDFRFNTQWVISIKQEFGKRAGYKAFIVYLYNEPIQTIIKDAIHVVRFKLKQYTRLIFKKNKND